jgi:hypothetical protein
MAARGENVIHVKGRDVYLLFTTRALLNAEQQLGKSISAIMRGFVTNTLGYTELVALLRYGMEAARMDARSGGRPVSNNDAIDIIDEVGFMAAINPVMEAVAAVASYKASEEGAAEEDGTDPN